MLKVVMLNNVALFRNIRSGSHENADDDLEPTRNRSESSAAHVMEFAVDLRLAV